MINFRVPLLFDIVVYMVMSAACSSCLQLQTSNTFYLVTCLCGHVKTFEIESMYKRSHSFLNYRYQLVSFSVRTQLNESQKTVLMSL